MSKKITEWRYYQGMPVGNVNELVEMINEGGSTGEKQWKLIELPALDTGFLSAEDLNTLKTNNYVAIIKYNAEGNITVFMKQSIIYNAGEATEMRFSSNILEETVALRINLVDGSYALGASTLASKADLDNKVSITNDATKVYGTDGDGKQTTFGINVDATAWTMAYRNADGNVNVATPTVDTHAATKKYADDLVKNTETLVFTLSDGTTKTVQVITK